MKKSVIRVSQDENDVTIIARLARSAYPVFSRPVGTAKHPTPPVIGTGVIGAAVALEMARGGWDVTSLDRHAMAGHGSASASSGMIRMHSSTRDGTALACEGQRLRANWAARVGLPMGTPPTPFRQCGCLMMKHAGNGMPAGIMAHSRALGIPFAEWGPEEIRVALPDPDLRRFWTPKAAGDPGFAEPTGETLADGVSWPDSGSGADPALAAQNLPDAARRAGAIFVRGEVVEILRGARTEGVRLLGGREMRADVTVNVAGPASSAINALAGVACDIGLSGDMGVGTRPQRVETTSLPAPSGYDMAARGFLVSDADIGVCGKPDVGGRVAVGTDWPRLRRSGPARDRKSRPGRGWRASGLAGLAPRAVCAVGAASGVGAGSGRGPRRLRRLAVGLRRSALPRFYMASGTSGIQFKAAPVSNRIMAAPIDHCAARGDRDTRPMRMELRMTGNRIDLGTVSRLRRASVESGMSVPG